MNPAEVLQSGKVILSGTTTKEYTWEHVSPQHLIVHIYSGELLLTYGQETLSFSGGDTILVPKNQLTRVVKSPKDGKPFSTVTLLLPEDELRAYFEGRTLLANWDEQKTKQRPIQSDPLLDSYFLSLSSYFETSDELPASLISLKIKEVLTIIDQIDQRASAILGSFSEPGKVDLRSYMEGHYMYNVPLDRFASLTGRSLTSFKSDFKKEFNTTPGKWLMKKRLELAYHKIAHEKQKATEVYLASGFENLSHFSFAFKKTFGQSPRSLNEAI